MRIIAGRLSGRQFNAPRGHRTHPMSDKARGGLFNALGDIEDLSVLDAFAGSGALGFEALSRGAGRVIAIEVDKNAHKIVEENAQRLNASNFKAIRANASGWSDNNPDARFDIIFCDPPYDNLQPNLIAKLARHLESDGIFVLSWPGQRQVPEITGLEVVQSKSYGDNQLVFYKPAQ